MLLLTVDRSALHHDACRPIVKGSQRHTVSRSSSSSNLPIFERYNRASRYSFVGQNSIAMSTSWQPLRAWILTIIYQTTQFGESVCYMYRTSVGSYNLRCTLVRNDANVLNAAFCCTIVRKKTVPEMTYNVFSGTLNPTHFTSRLTCSVSKILPCTYQLFPKT